jgi:hypothetical protein
LKPTAAIGASVVVAGDVDDDVDDDVDVDVVAVVAAAVVPGAAVDTGALSLDEEPQAAITPANTSGPPISASRPAVDIESGVRRRLAKKFMDTAVSGGRHHHHADGHHPSAITQSDET